VFTLQLCYLSVQSTLNLREDVISRDQRVPVKYTPPPTIKHTQHTVNPLIAPDVNPFLPSAISTVSVLFISTDHCISFTGDVSGS
ncbi:unnamed protein product, partial [Staurois parvus]